MTSDENAGGDFAVPPSAAATPPARRRTRARGRESRQKILEAAARVAGERGYDGATIARVSKESGLPASSIYWHFADKDALLAAVVEASFELWLGRVSLAIGATAAEKVRALSESVARAFRESPDFLRLGLMLALERRSDELEARRLYLRLRHEALDRFVGELLGERSMMSVADARRLVTYALAGGEGILLAAAAGDDDVDELFALHATAVLHLADVLESGAAR